MDRVTVLIVDDSDTDRYLLRRDLEAADVPVDLFEASDGAEGLAFLSDFDAKKEQLGDRFPPQLIFVDINMPRVNGFKFLDAFEELRNQRSGYDSCVIMMFSSSEHKAERELALAKSFVVDFVTKGKTTPAELKRMVQEALHRL